MCVCKGKQSAKMKWREKERAGSGTGESVRCFLFLFVSVWIWWSLLPWGIENTGLCDEKEGKESLKKELAESALTASDTAGCACAGPQRGTDVKLTFREALRRH